MLVAYPPDPAGQRKLADSTWVDLIDPTSVERATFEDTFGLRVPAQDELGEIEATSRLQVENGALYMTAPLILPPPAKSGCQFQPASCWRSRCL
jgi:Mg2+ and Co2+ transporter CorA